MPKSLFLKSLTILGGLLVIGCSSPTLAKNQHQNTQEKGAAVSPAHNNGVFPLLVAAGFGHLEVVKLLLENDADIHQKHAQFGNALDLALLEGKGDVAEFLRSKGARESK